MPLDAGDEIGAVAIAAGMRRVALADAADRIAAQRHDVAHAGRAIVADHVVDLVAGRRHAGQMRRRRERGLGQDALDGRVRALARRAAGAVGDRDEVGRERRQPRDRFPQRLLHLLGLRREELERDADAASVAGVEAAGARRRRSSGDLQRGRLRQQQAADRARARARPRSCRRRRAPAPGFGAAPRRGRRPSSTASPSRAQSRAGDGRARRAGTRGRAARNRRPAAARPGAARARPPWIARAPSSRKCST